MRCKVQRSNLFILYTDTVISACFGRNPDPRHSAIAVRLDSGQKHAEMTKNDHKDVLGQAPGCSSFAARQHIRVLRLACMGKGGNNGVKIFILDALARWTYTSK